MPLLLRAVGAIVLVFGLLVPGTVSAAEPPRPLPGTRPDFVTERETGKWTDCLWASGAMLVDKWTAGRTRISKDRLRALSGDLEGGSTLEHLTTALDKIGLRARTSPEGGDTISWTDLRRRLLAGGGAILLGDDHELPRWYGRWDPAFWRKTGADDNHAVYIDRYERRTDRYWLMDPLAPAGWPGEWISGRALRAFAWSNANGDLFGVLTPAAAPAPFAGVELNEPIAFAGLDGLRVAWPVAVAPKGWRLPGVDVATSVEPLPAGTIPTGTVVLAPPVSSSATPVPSADTLRYGDSMLFLRHALPEAPGAYSVAVDVRERRFGTVVTRADVTVYVPGERRGAIAAAAPAAPLAIGPLAFELDVTNTGSVSWAEAPRPLDAPPGDEPLRRTRLVARWVPLDAPAAGADAIAVPAPVELRPVALDPGRSSRLTVSLATPRAVGRWLLAVDLVDNIDGSFAVMGSAPLVIPVELVEAVNPEIVPD